MAISVCSLIGQYVVLIHTDVSQLQYLEHLQIGSTGNNIRLTFVVLSEMSLRQLNGLSSNSFLGERTEPEARKGLFAPEI